MSDKQDRNWILLTKCDSTLQVAIPPEEIDHCLYMHERYNSLKFQTQIYGHETDSQNQKVLLATVKETPAEILAQVKDDRDWIILHDRDTNGEMMIEASSIVRLSQETSYYGSPVRTCVAIGALDDKGRYRTIYECRETPEEVLGLIKMRRLAIRQQFMDAAARTVHEVTISNVKPVPPIKFKGPEPDA